MTLRQSLALAAAGVACSVTPLFAATLTIACGGAPGSYEACRNGSQAWAQARGQEVRVLRYPEASAQARDLVDELLRAHVDDLDVVEVDIVWPGALAEHLVDLGSALGADADQHFQSARASFSVEGRLLAAPWFLSVGRLFYRSDLLAQQGLAPPTTWEELAAAARALQERERSGGNGEFWGLLWQGRAGEGLTVNAVEWLASQGAPGLLGQDAAITLESPEASLALSQASAWIGSISPETVLEMGGEQSLESFVQGKAAFLRYWSNGLGVTQGAESPVRGKVGVSDLPAGTGPTARRAGVLGGFGLAVSRYGKEQALATDLVRYLTSAEEQKLRALAGPFDPSRPALYADPELLAAHPGYPELRQALEGAVVRPAAQAARRYDMLSDAFAAGVHDILQSGEEPGPALAELAATLRRVGADRRQSGS